MINNEICHAIKPDGKKMDKSGILRATIAFLKKHNESTQRNRAFEIDLSWKPSFLSNDEFSQMMMESIDGFCISFKQVTLSYSLTN